MNKYLSKNIKVVVGVVFSGFLVISFSSCVLAKAITPNNIIGLVNQERENNNLDPLFLNANLSQAAEAKAQDMLANNYFAHTSPQGKTPWHWIEKAKYRYKHAGENLAMGFSGVEEEHQAWMNSTTHKQNILNERYQEIGVAVAEGVINDRNTTIVVQEFGARNDFVASLNKTDNNMIKISENKEILGAMKEIKQSIVIVDWNNALNTGTMLLFCIIITANTIIMAYISLNYLNLINSRKDVC